MECEIQKLFVGLSISHCESFKKIIDGIKILQKNEKNISTSVKSRTKKTTKKFVIVCVNI